MPWHTGRHSSRRQGLRHEAGVAEASRLSSLGRRTIGGRPRLDAVFELESEHLHFAGIEADVDAAGYCGHSRQAGTAEAAVPVDDLVAAGFTLVDDQALEDTVFLKGGEEAGAGTVCVADGSATRVIRIAFDLVNVDLAEV